MYELVLMMALSQGTATPGWQPEAAVPAVKQYGVHGHREYRHRRCGCHGGGYGGCMGGYGGCSGGWGGYGGYGCMGSYGGWGGGYGCMGGYAGSGGYGGCTGGYAGGYAGGYGCTGGYAGYAGGSGYATFYGGGYPSGYAFSGPTYSMPVIGANQDMGMAQAQTNANQATLVVDLPANARLTIDGQPTQLTSATRTFVSPPLDPGKEYFYDLKAELNRDGKTLTASKRVTIRPGQETHVQLNFSGQTATTEE